MARILFDKNGKIVGIEREYPPPTLRSTLYLIFIHPFKYKWDHRKGRTCTYCLHCNPEEDHD